MGISYTGFGEIENQIDSLESYLSSKNIHLSPTSWLRRAICNARKALGYWKQQADLEDSGYDVEQGRDDLANVYMLCRLVLDAKDTYLESLFVPRLGDLTKGSPGILTPGTRSRPRDRLFEMYCAHLCSKFATEVDFHEPDVTCQYRSTRWGVACKASYGTPQTVAKAIREGMKQIADSDVDFGIVAVQMTNIFPREEMYARHADGDILTLHDRNAYEDLFTWLLKKTARPLQAAREKDLRQNPFAISHKVRAVLYLVHVVSYYGGRIATMGGTYAEPLGKIAVRSHFNFAVRFNDWWQRA